MSLISVVETCRICNNSDLITVIDLGHQVISSQFPNKDEPDPPTAPLILVKCNDTENHTNCGLVQLKHTINADELYTHHYGYRSGLNNTMKNHLKNLAHEIEERIKLRPNDIVVDIGSNDCTLLKAYTISNKRIGIDPTGEQFRKFYPSDIILVPDFFSENAFSEALSLGNWSNIEKARVVTSISMFYDLPDPVGFMQQVHNILADDGIWVMEQSYIVTMLERNSFDTICHEHLEYYAYKQIAWMADNVGFDIIDVSLNDCNGGSFRVTLAKSRSIDSVPFSRIEIRHDHFHSDQHCDKKTVLSSFADDTNPLLYTLNTENQKFIHQINQEQIDLFIAKEGTLRLSELSTYTAFNERCSDLKNQLVTFLKTQQTIGKSVYIYGASTKGNTLLQYYGIDSSLIKAAAERNPDKYGRRTPKTGIPIISEAEMRLEKPDYLLVLPWHFKEEFLKRESEYLDQGGQYIFPLPVLDVVKTKKCALVTGISGQIGSYLSTKLLDKGYIVYGQTRCLQNITKNPAIYYYECDLMDTHSLKEMITMIMPDEIYHLAAETNAITSIENPIESIYLNGNVVSCICEIVRDLSMPISVFPDPVSAPVSIPILTTNGDLPSLNNSLIPTADNTTVTFPPDLFSFSNTPFISSIIDQNQTPEFTTTVPRKHKRIKIIVTNSSEIYKGFGGKIDEECLTFYPKNPYAIGKIAAYWSMRYYREQYGIFCANAIVFNTESPLRKDTYVTKKIIKGLKKIVDAHNRKLYINAPLKLGNIDQTRDWIHAEDVANALVLIMDQPIASDYVVSSGECHSIREFVTIASEKMNSPIAWVGKNENEVAIDGKGNLVVTIDKSLYRSYEPNATLPVMGDNTKLQSIGWIKKYTLPELIQDML